MPCERSVIPVVLLSALAACGAPASEDPRPAPSRAPATTPLPRAPAPRAVPPSTPARCPAGLARCRAVAGRIVYVERVDPDGDGDLHVVIAGGGVTAPGLTAVDVKPALRPRRDPRIGDRATAAGQVQPGTYGQEQIHASSFAVRPR